MVFAGPGGGNGVPAGTRTPLTRDNLRRAYHTAVARVADPGRHPGLHPQAGAAGTPRRGPCQTSQVLRNRLPDRRLTLGTLKDAL
jgi:hypothetical protein